MQPTELQDLPDRRPGLARLAVIGRQAVWFTAIGSAMTVAYLVLYLVLRNVLSAQPANYVAWAITAIGDTAANRRFTFDASCRVSEKRAQVEGLLIFVIALVLTSASLAVLDAYVEQPGAFLELVVLLSANLAAGLLRFELLRRWVFAER
jgi:putative flippase GtrA